MATGHGHTPAAWTAVTIMFVGCLVGAAGVVYPSAIWLLFVGLGIVAVGAIVGKVMQMMGLGQPMSDRRGERESKVASH